MKKLNSNLDFVAEIGLNYNANLNLAFELIRQARNSGANVAKFQLGWRSGVGELNHLTESDLVKLKTFCDENEIELMFSIINDEALELIECIEVNRFKIASRTVVDNPNLCERILQKGKPTFLSLGMWNESEFPFRNFSNLKYIWCNSKYPTMKSDMNYFPKIFDDQNYFGYSDHALGISYCLAAISRGAKYVEKHFTLDKSNDNIRDHVLSATPSEFSDLVTYGREIHLNLYSAI